MQILTCTHIHANVCMCESNPYDKIKRNFFQTVLVPILQYGCTTSTLTRRIFFVSCQRRCCVYGNCVDVVLYGNCARMLRNLLNKSWKQNPLKQKLYSHLSPISKTIQVRQRRPAKSCWRNNDELISDVLLLIPSFGRVDRPARTCLQQLCADTGCSLEDLPGAMDERDGWKERVKEICAGSST